ncbi:MAG: ABC transporter substrate binding protein [Blastocatellales bacterium]
MNAQKDSARHFSLRIAIISALFAWLAFPPLPSGARAAEEAAKPKGVLAIYWRGKDSPTSVTLDKSIQKAFQSAPAGSIEYYAEYLDESRFPGESQSLLFRDYLRQKYAGDKIDALIALSSASLNFLLKYRNELFPNIPIVFHASSRAQLSKQAEAGLTGVLVDGAFRNTLDLALKLHPDTEQALIITATPEHDGKLEAEIRQELKEFESRVALTYLTDSPLDKLIARVKGAPARSIILFVRYSQDDLGRSLDSHNVLTLVAGSSRVPVYTAAGSLLGRGSVGGHAANLEDCGTRAAEIALRIVNGVRPQDIPVVTVPTVPMFDWRQLKRWGISEAQLPPGSKILFKEPTFWEQYKWRVVGSISLFIIETLLIVGLLAQRVWRKRVKETLAEKDQRLRETQTTAHLGNFHWDAAANTVAWSDELYRIHGLEPGALDITYETYLNQVHPGHREQVRKTIERALTDRESFEHEYRIVHPTGATRWVFTHSRPIIDASGALIALQGICQDITERKQAEAALRESEERFSKAFHSSPQPMSITTLEEGRYVDVNDRFLEVSGYTREEVIGHKSLELNIWENPAARAELITPLKQGRMVRNWETKFGTKRGDFRVFLSSAELIELGERMCVLVASSDITERKQAEEALRESEERARRALVEQMLAGVIECDTTGKFTMVNQRFCEIVGYTEAELLGMSVGDLTHPEDLTRISELYRRLVEAGESYVTEKRCRHKDGSEVWVNSNASPVRNARGAVEKAVAVVICITDRKRAEREREQLLKQEKAARAEAQAANQSKDEFLAVVSHELRSPLNSILGYARLLRVAPVDAAQIKYMVGIIENSGRMQLQLIEDLLDTARIISGKLKLEVQPVDLASLISAALDVVRPAAKAKDIELIPDLDPLTDQVSGDPGRLQQVIWNLLSNAIKFTPRSGCVKLRMESVDHHVRITVSDTGKGIEPEFLPFVFDRFRQFDSSSSRRFGGLGLGLSLAKQLVELHGGTIEAASDGPGRGAAFTVTLPQGAAQSETFIQSLWPQPPAVAVGEMRTEITIPLERVPSLSGVRALVVDDQEEARALLRAILGECGAQVTAVSSGVEALAILSDPPGGEAPDVMILDIAMPDEDGYRVLERVRAFEAERGIPESDQIPAIALTAHARSEDRLKALAAGFRMHVAKPVEPAELALVIASLVERLGVGTSA